MKKFLLVVAIAALAVPAAYAAEPSAKSSSAQCKALQNAAGTKMFGANGQTYRNLGHCVRVKDAQAAATASAAALNAAKACKAERAMDESAFRSAHGDKTFNAFYGKNDNDRNAYGKCVSSKAQAEADARTAARQQAELKAAKACKEQARNAEAFKAAYGSAKNAFGRCVSKAARAN